MHYDCDKYNRLAYISILHSISLSFAYHVSALVSFNVLLKSLFNNLIFVTFNSANCFFSLKKCLMTAFCFSCLSYRYHLDHYWLHQAYHNISVIVINTAFICCTVFSARSFPFNFHSLMLFLSVGSLLLVLNNTLSTN